MEDLSNYKKYIKINLVDGKIVTIPSYINFKLFIVYQEVKDIDVVLSEKFRELISRGEIIQEFKKEDYKKLSYNDLIMIADKFTENNDPQNIDNRNAFSEIFRLMDEEENKMIESVKSLLIPIEKFKFTIEKKSGNILETMSDFYKMNKRIVEKLAPIRAKILSSSIHWSEKITKFIIEQNEYLNVKDKSSLIATKYDWFIAYDFYTSKSFYEKLIKLDKKGVDTEEIDNLFVEYYDFNFKSRIIKDIRESKLVEEFDEIIIQIQYGYEHELYYLVVPTLFVIIEGMIARGFNHTGKMNGREFKKYINELVSDDKVNSLHEIINQRMLAGFEHGNKIDSPISRHAILHGGDINYGREAIALRLLLIFYNLVFAMGFYNFSKDEKHSN